ncbi:uncharacterized protein LOC143062955 [Mytilus galloprovincialis]|uniref:Uncharacterized protein n=1 Tax=Mytilus galloprovincialis TaxID=29158 RepID=A0A8B6GGH0_MYTGA|nr:Hypothetical predicted protein [Mytilus galloprovincialis]
MCRWGCSLTNTTYMCKWCGTRYCKECLKGEFQGEMKEATKCRICNQTRCQGQRIEYVPRTNKPDEEDGKNKRGAPSRARSAKSAKSVKGKKGSAKKKKKK